MAQNGRSERQPAENTDTIAQNVPLRDDQRVNSAGGYVWIVDDFKRLHRFLVLGSELPTFYIGERELGLQNAQAIKRLLDSGRGVEVVGEVLTFSLEGRTAKQNPIMLVLAMCARMGDLTTKRKAYEVLPQVCRIPTHLFMFVGFCKKFSKPSTGWGRAARTALKKWYTDRAPMKLAMDVTKYQKREGWSHKDIVRLIHLKSEVAGTQCVMRYVAKGFEEVEKAFPQSDDSDEELVQVLQFLKAVEEMKQLTLEDADRVVELIEQQDLVREHIPTVCLGSAKVWEALLKKMPMTAMIRNLNKMTAVGLLSEGSSHVQSVCEKLRSEKLLRKARIHPFNVLLALKQYQAGRGDKGALKWEQNIDITRALEDAFYVSFKNVEPTGKKFMIALDVSGSMQCGGCNGAASITPCHASAAMAMVAARTEQYHQFVAFSDELVPIGIHSDMKLEDVIHAISAIRMGGTDCALPMLYAKEQGLEIDVFIVYTDCETWIGDTHPSEALKQYRTSSGIDAKLIVVAMTSNGFTIADPDDPGMFDIVGFDSAAPQVMREFILGNI